MSNLAYADSSKLRKSNIEAGFGYLLSGLLPKADSDKWSAEQDVDNIRLDWAKRLQKFLLETNKNFRCFNQSDWIDFLNSHESDNYDDWVIYNVLNEPEKVLKKTDGFNKEDWIKNKWLLSLSYSTVLRNNEAPSVEMLLMPPRALISLSFDKLFDSASHRISNAYGLTYKDFVLLFDIVVRHFQTQFMSLCDRDYIQNIVITDTGSEVHEFKTFPHREAGGWMVYVAAQVTKEQIPAAHEIIRLSSGGSLIISQPEFFSAFEEAHVKRANLIEVQLNELGLLPETLVGLDELEGVTKGWVKPISG